MAEFSICQFFEQYFGNLSRNGRYSVFRPRNGDGKIQFLIENTTATVFIQKFDYSTTVLFEKINSNTAQWNLLRRTPFGTSKSVRLLEVFVL